MDITEICLECKNFFLRDGVKDIHSNVYTISGHAIAPLDFIIPGQFFRITGSVLNDGVYQNTAEGLASLQDETFEGNIWAMAVPPAFLKLCEEIDTWQNKYGAVGSTNMSPYQSESISGVYSRTKASGGSSAGIGESSVQTWQSVYKSRLNKWRRISIL
jgi:hypothetical protein